MFTVADKILLENHEMTNCYVVPRLRPLLLLAGAVFVSGTSGVAQNVSQTGAIEKQIEANNQAVGRAIHTRDFSTLEKLWSPQMVVNNPANGIFTRADVFAAIRHGGLNYSSLKGTSESFKVFGDVAVEMGHEDFVMADGPAAGKPLQRRYTDVWQLTHGRWVQIARQATILSVDAASVYGSLSAAPKAQQRERLPQRASPTLRAAYRRSMRCHAQPIHEHRNRLCPQGIMQPHPTALLGQSRTRPCMQKAVRLTVPSVGFPCIEMPVHCPPPPAPRPEL